ELQRSDGRFGRRSRHRHRGCSGALRPRPYLAASASAHPRASCSDPARDDTEPASTHECAPFTWLKTRTKRSTATSATTTRASSLGATRTSNSGQARWTTPYRAPDMPKKMKRNALYEKERKKMPTSNPAKDTRSARAKGRTRASSAGGGRVTTDQGILMDV